MRKLILSMMVSLDGHIEDAQKQIEWHVWDDEMSRYMNRFFESVDTILFGRVTYQIMADFWPTSASSSEDSGIADRMNTLPKIVFSKTLETVTWGDWDNVRLIKGNIAEEVQELKKQKGKDLVLFGGANLASSFIQLQLFDEYQLIINPVVLGDGTPLFQDLPQKLGLELLGAQATDCGNVILTYKPSGLE